MMFCVSMLLCDSDRRDKRLPEREVIGRALYFVQGSLLPLGPLEMSSEPILCSAAPVANSSAISCIIFAARSVGQQP
jgi:hypothetical protein